MTFLKSNVKAVFLYGSETWMTAKTIMKKVPKFINVCLRKVLQIHWPETIYCNSELWQRTEQLAVEEDMRRNWKWIIRALRKAPRFIMRQTLTWNIQGRRKRGQPRNCWRKDLEADSQETGYNLNQVERLAQDRGPLACCCQWPIPLLGKAS